MTSKNFCYPTEKISVNEWLIKGGRIGAESMYGQIFIACKKLSCGYVLKVIKGETHQEIENEVYFQKECAQAGLCKPVEDWWLCTDDGDHEKNRGGVIITPVLQYTVKQAIKSGVTDDELINLVKSVIEITIKLHSVGIIHGDLHLNNVMVDSSDKVWFIDLGKASSLDKYKGDKRFDKIKIDYEEIAAGIGSIDGKRYEDLLEILLGAINDFTTQYKFLKLKNKNPSLEEILAIEKEVMSNINFSI